jgi:hypothetical protein
MSADNDYIYAPRPNTATKATQQRMAVSAASASVALAPNLAKNGWIYVTASGADVDFTISEAAGTLVKDAVGSGTTVAPPLPAGQTRRLYIALTGAAGFITAIASGAGFLTISRAGAERVNAVGI